MGAPHGELKQGSGGARSTGNLGLGEVGQAHCRTRKATCSQAKSIFEKHTSLLFSSRLSLTVGVRLAHTSAHDSSRRLRNQPLKGRKLSIASNPSGGFHPNPPGLRRQDNPTSNVPLSPQEGRLMLPLSSSCIPMEPMESIEVHHGCMQLTRGVQAQGRPTDDGETAGLRRMRIGPDWTVGKLTSVNNPTDNLSLPSPPRRHSGLERKVKPSCGVVPPSRHYPAQTLGPSGIMMNWWHGSVPVSQGSG
jgi:hypothetical protein